MRKTLILLVIFNLVTSCNRKVENQVVKNTNVSSDEKMPASVPAMIKKLTFDHYPVTNGMLYDKKHKDVPYKKQSGKTISSDKVWFSNDSLKQVLVFELYTDYHRLATYHFLSNDIPSDLIHEMELHIDGGEFAPDQQKLKDFDGFLKQATKISSSYFVTHKGFRLGDIKQRAVEIYGNPDKQNVTNGIEKLEWAFTGDNFYDGKTDLKGKPLAEDSFGHQVIMYFKNGKLIAQILCNEIP